MPQVFFVERILVLTPATFPQAPFSLGLCFCYYVPRWRTGFFVVVFTNPVAADVFVWLADFALIPATLLQAFILSKSLLIIINHHTHRALERCALKFYQARVRLKDTPLKFYQARANFRKILLDFLPSPSHGLCHCSPIRQIEALVMWMAAPVCLDSKHA